MHQYSQGKFTTQAHKGIPEGAFEEEQGRRGFFGPVSHLLKASPSTRWIEIDGPLRPHLFDGVKLPQVTGVWQRLLYNSDVTLYNYYEARTDGVVKHGFRNADGDTLYFCHKGNGLIFTEFGQLTFEPGQYILIPKCITHSFCAFELSQFIVIESLTSAYREPDRGMVGRNAFYDPAAFGKPDLEKQICNKNLFDVRTIVVKRSSQMTKFFYNECYYDTLGWKGDLFPITLHIRDLMPMLSARVHLPPSAHTTFVSQNFVVCTFLPRPLESDADALKVPFYHQNIDYDEVLFYHDGNFFSRDNLHAGMFTLHPAGFPHGPHPKAVQNVKNKTHTDEVAVMIDTWGRLEIDPEFLKVEVDDYWKSWKS